MAIEAHPLGAFKNVRAFTFGAVLRRRLRLEKHVEEAFMHE
jgi:hypothetical protein